MTEAVQQAEHHDLSDADYSKAVQKRIGKEVAKRKTAEDSFHTAQEDAASWRKRAEDAEERIETAEGERLKKTKENLPDMLKQAIEDGDTDAQTKYLSEMAQVNSEDTEYVRRQKERKARQEEKPEPDTRHAAPEQPEALHPSADAFLKRSKDWFESNSDARKRAIAIETELRDDEKMELGDDLYAELESRLFDEMPDLSPESGAGPEPEPEHEPASEPEPVAHASRGAGRRPARRSQGNHMSTAAKATMKRYGLDPDNASDIKGFLKHHKGV